jgi:hypothetical protein
MSLPLSIRNDIFRFGGTIVITPALALALRADLAPNVRRRGFVVAFSFQPSAFSLHTPL